MLMRWLETFSEFWTDTLQPSEDPIGEFESYFKGPYCYRVVWKLARPLWPRRCFITGKWLWFSRSYRVTGHFARMWFTHTEVVWIEFTLGTQIKLMI